MALVSSLTVPACGNREASERALPPLETTIARELTARFGVPVTTRCVNVGSVPVLCHAVLADGTALPIALERRATAVLWHIAGRVVETKPIAAYVAGVLEDLGVEQRAACGPPVLRLGPGQRVACALSGGGAAFVQVARDGALSVELALDPAAAAARGSAATDSDLTHRSRALDKPDEAGEPSP